jgi:hypothetical protein
VQKERDKAWHDRHIEKKIFKEGDLVLLYEKKYLQHPGKFMLVVEPDYLLDSEVLAFNRVYTP